jgi:aryl-phospho-beta-D-glucosidase BglC (GH1 family)
MRKTERGFAAVMAALCLTAYMLVPLRAEGVMPLHKGVNAFPWLYRARSIGNKGEVYSLDQSFPYFGDYTPEKLAHLKKTGFDFIRIPVEPDAFLTVKPEQRAKLISQVLAAVSLSADAGLTAIIDFHPKEASSRWNALNILNSEDNKNLYRDVLVEIAGTIVKQSKKNAILELMNEPPGGWGARDALLWQNTQRDFVKAIRRAAPDLPLIVTGDRGGGIDGLLRLVPEDIDDPQIFYSFHYYDPMVVTHQGATWSSRKSREYLTGVGYPPARQDAEATRAMIKNNISSHVADSVEAERLFGEANTDLQHYFDSSPNADKITADFARVSGWARAHRIPASRILLGEFGIYRPAASRETAIQYLKDIRRSAEAAGFAWAFFNYEPNEKLPAFTMLQLPGPTPANFDPGIVGEGLGLSMSRP